MAIKGRGTSDNIPHRFSSRTTEFVDDGWWQRAAESRIMTRTIPEQVRTIVTTNSSPDIPFDRSINPYRGCEHGCIYCYARPSHAYWDLSPGLDFETQIISKRNGAERLTETLSRPDYQVRPIMIGANTDPYQPLESSEQNTRRILEVLAQHAHPFTLITKSTMILRDLDILGPMARRRLCSVAVSVTTLDNQLKRKLEPRTASPTARLRTIATLSAAEVPVTIMAAPMIPGINDSEIEAIVDAGRKAGASQANYIFVRLPLEVRPLFEDWLHEHFPDRAAHVMSLIRQSRGGKDYDPAFFERMRGRGSIAAMIAQRFRVAARQAGFDVDSRDQHLALDTSQFVAPNRQMTLF